MASSAKPTTEGTAFRHVLVAALAAFALLLAPLALAAESSASDGHHSSPLGHGHDGHHGDDGGVEHGLASCGPFSCAPAFVMSSCDDFLPHLRASSGSLEPSPDRLGRSLFLDGDPPVPRSRFS